MYMAVCFTTATRNNDSCHDNIKVPTRLVFEKKNELPL